MRIFVLVMMCLTLISAETNVGRDKAEQLRELSSVSEDNIIVLNSTGYEHFIVDYPRPYDVVILFNADYNKFQCRPCQEIGEQFKEVSFSYTEQGAEYPSVDGSGNRQRAVFFATMDYAGENQVLFKQHGFVSVPVLLVTHPKSIYFDGSTYNVLREDQWEFHSGTDITA